jgi:acetyl-CoA C-acetyltransferase
MSWPYDDPTGRLADALSIEPTQQVYSGIGGTTPHALITQAAQEIEAGRLDVALVVGCEALETVRQAKKASERLPWSFRDPDRKPFPFEAPFHPAEMAHGVFPAWMTFALFDVARRARLGTAPEEYRRQLGALLAPMTEVAAANPYAWKRQVRGVDDLIDATPDNRMVGYPYTKAMVAIMDVDMAAAVVVASDQAADRLGVPADRRVYLRGWADAVDPVYVAAHPDLAASPAMAAASTAALGAAGIGVDDVAHLDLYSCFASSLNLATDALGLAAGDHRGLTVTGGLPFAGGPGSAYLLHSTAAMVDTLRADPGSFGLVSGVGMHMTKHAFDVYSTTPPPPGAALAGTASDTAPAELPIVDTYQGPATVATYTVIHDRGGQPEWGLAICDVPGGDRCYARFDQPGLLKEALDTEWVGTGVEVTTGEDQVNRIGGGPDGRA